MLQRSDTHKQSKPWKLSGQKNRIEITFFYSYYYFPFLFNLSFLPRLWKIAYLSLHYFVYLFSTRQSIASKILLHFQNFLFSFLEKWKNWQQKLVSFTLLISLVKKLVLYRILPANVLLISPKKAAKKKVPRYLLFRSCT